jgi:hypothetical protein
MSEMERHKGKALGREERMETMEVQKEKRKRNISENCNYKWPLIGSGKEHHITTYNQEESSFFPNVSTCLPECKALHSRRP